MRTHLQLSNFGHICVPWWRYFRDIHKSLMLIIAFLFQKNRTNFSYIQIIFIQISSPLLIYLIANTDDVSLVRMYLCHAGELLICLSTWRWQSFAFLCFALLCLDLYWFSQLFLLRFSTLVLKLHFDHCRRCHFSGQFHWSIFFAIQGNAHTVIAFISI